MWVTSDKLKGQPVLPSTLFSAASEALRRLGPRLQRWRGAGLWPSRGGQVLIRSQPLLIEGTEILA